MKYRLLFLIVLLSDLIQSKPFDHHEIKKYTQENLDLLKMRNYKQMGYAALIAATIYGAGCAVLDSTNNMNYLAGRLRELPSKAHLDSPQVKIVSGNFFNTFVSNATDLVYAAGSIATVLTYQVGMGLTSAAITAFAQSIASRNGILKNAYTDIIAAFTKPDVQWYIDHYVPIYDHLDSFKYCAIYFDMNSPFLVDVHNNAITMQYIESVIKSEQQGKFSGYAQFLQKKSESSVASAQELLKYDTCLAAYRYRKQLGQVVEEDNSLIVRMHELHSAIIEDVKRILGFIYALSEHHKHHIDDCEKKFLEEVAYKMSAYADYITWLLQATEDERDQASLQGKGMFTTAYEFQLYCKTIFRS